MIYRFKKIYKNKKKLIIFFLLAGILLLGLYLRHINYRTIPRHGATFDEFAWTWLGINIIQKGVPVSWSSQPQYKQRKHLIYQGAAFWIVSPYLEHPPLFGLIAGSSSVIWGVKDMYTVTLANMRPLAQILGILSIIMVFIFVSQLYDTQTALLAALFYSTIPTIVIGSRIVQNENFMIPVWLLSLILITYYLKTGKKRFRNIAAILAGLLSLAKAPWLVVGLSLSFILSYHNKWKDAIIVGLITLGIFSLFILWGLYWDKELFLNLWKLQTARYDIKFEGLFSLFINPLLVDRFYLDGWIYFGWLSIVLLAQEFKKHIMILIPFFTYLFMYLFAIPDEPSHGWYRYPFYPFLIIAIAYLIKKEKDKITLFSLFFLLIIGLSLLTNVWLPMFGFSLIVYRLFLLTIFFIIFILLWFKRYSKFSNKILLACIVLLIIGNIFAVMVFNDI